MTSGSAAKSRERKSGGKTGEKTIVTKPADWFQNGFHRFLGTYLGRHFHAIAEARENNLQSQWETIADRSGQPSPIDDPQIPLIVYSNHPSWWDPLLAHYMNHRLMAPRQFYAPIDLEALQQYKVFEKLGFFGVDSKSNRGAAQFLRATAEIFGRDHSALWVTPEGRFADVRDHEAELMPGLSHVCAKLDRGWVVPVALEYVFWDESLPEVLFRFGDVVAINEVSDWDKSRWSDELASRLRSTQTRLAELSVGRSSEPFENLLRGKQGARGLYDVSRRMKSWLTGKSFRASHGEQFQ